jgi:hypothetical protein
MTNAALRLTRREACDLVRHAFESLSAVSPKSSIGRYHAPAQRLDRRRLPDLGVAFEIGLDEIAEREVSTRDRRAIQLGRPITLR